MLLMYLAALALAATVLAASGCGGSSKSGSTSTSASAPTTTTTTASTSTTPPATTTTVKVAAGKPLTHAQWIAKGDAICARLNAELAANTVKSTAEFARVLPVAAADEQAELAQLVKLVPPTSKTKDWQEFLTGTQEWAANSYKLAESSQSGSFTLKAPLVATTRKIHETLAHLAQHEGFKECSLV
jgi:hypothetical protein